MLPAFDDREFPPCHQRALRLFESIEELVSRITMSARSAAEEPMIRESARCASEAETLVLNELHRDARGLAKSLIRIRRRVGELADDIDASAARRHTGSTPPSVA